LKNKTKNPYTIMKTETRKRRKLGFIN